MFRLAARTACTNLASRFRVTEEHDTSFSLRFEEPKHGFPSPYSVPQNGNPGIRFRVLRGCSAPFASADMFPNAGRPNTVRSRSPWKRLVYCKPVEDGDSLPEDGEGGYVPIDGFAQ